MTERFDEWLSLALYAFGACLMLGIFHHHWPVHVTGPHRHQVER
jgi:hypothetical protein